jgi:uncharacterized membrane protein YdcZ (DUF606 family)
MIFGLDGFTLFHVAISIIGLGAGFMVVGGFLANTRLPATTFVFLAATIVTNATGFGFPFQQLLPSHIVAIISLVILAVTTFVYYGTSLTGAARWIFVAGSTAALYLNVFVLVAQLFNKVPSLANLAPTQAEPPFAATQGLTLVVFLILSALAIRKFHPVD